MIKCLIVDDQQYAIDTIAEHMQKIQPFTLVNTFTNSLKALEFIENYSIDVVFIDVEMPHLTGIDLIETLIHKKGNNIPYFILTTGHCEYALKGFEQGVIDYLLKPVDFTRCRMALDRLLHRMNKTNIHVDIPEQQYLFVEMEGKKVRVNYNDIFFVEAKGNYLYICTNSRNFIAHRSMISLQQQLPEKDFARIHKSYIVPLNQIQSICANEVCIHMNEKVKNIPIGITYKEELYKKLKIN